MPINKVTGPEIADAFDETSAPISERVVVGNENVIFQLYLKWLIKSKRKRAKKKSQ
jgi:hypothetical protein